jgi:hypothetical protein
MILAAQRRCQLAGSRFLLILATVLSLAFGSCSKWEVNPNETKLPPGGIVLRGAGASFA